METGSAEDGSGDALHGLAFGKKVYFEDGGGGSGKAVPAAKRGKAAAGQQPAARCQVEGCKADLAGVKAYYWRHKVCGAHSKAPKVIVAGLEQRFCQQCSRFHQLPEFDQGKRSCRRRLAGHNERRRKPPPVPIAPHYGRFASSLREDSSRFRNSLMDFTYPAPLGTISRNIWPTVRASERVPSNQWQGGQWQGGFEVPTGGVLVHCPHSSMHAVMGGSLFSAPPPNESLAGASDSCCALSLLSNEPWSSATRNEARTILRSANSEGAPVAQPVIAANYMTNSWGFRCHGAGSSSNEIQHDLARAGRATDADRGECTDELELALQGGRQCQNISPGRACSRFGDVMHWSL